MLHWVLCRRTRWTKKALEVAISPLSPPIPLTQREYILACGVVWPDVINSAKFQLNRFRGFGAPGGRKSLSPIDWRYRPYNSVRTNVLYTVIVLYPRTWVDEIIFCGSNKVLRELADGDVVRKVESRQRWSIEDPHSCDWVKCWVTDWFSQIQVQLT